MLSLGRKSSVGDSTEGVAFNSEEGASSSEGRTYGNRAQRPSKGLLGVFGGLERRRSSGGKVKDTLTESIDLKMMSSQFASLVEEMDGEKDESPLIKARREAGGDEGDGGDGHHGNHGHHGGEVAIDHLKRTTTVTSMLSQMTTHDVVGKEMVIGENIGENTGASLADASSVDVGVGSLKRTLEESEGDEVWYATSTEDTFVETHSLLREASVAHKLVGMERKLDVFSGQIRQCVVAAMKMEHLSAQIHRVTSSATKAQMDVERRFCSLAAAVRKDESLAAQVAELESKFRVVRSQLSQLEDDLEQERMEQQQLAEAGRAESERQSLREKRTGIQGLMAVVARNLAVPVLVIVLSAGVRKRA